MLTVNELIAQLETLRTLGMGEYSVWVRDDNDCDWLLAQGVYDFSEENNGAVVLG